MKKFVTLSLLLLLGGTMSAKNYRLQSPDKQITVTVTDKPALTYAVSDAKGVVLAPTEIAMTLTDGTVWGDKTRVRGVKRSAKNETLASPLYKRAQVQNHYNAMTLRCGDFSVEFRAFNDGVAYRFVSHKKGAFEVLNETANFTFEKDFVATVPYTFLEGDTEDATDFSYEGQFFTSFENTYTQSALSALRENRLFYVPMLVSLEAGRKVLLTEVNLESYPGMYLCKGNAPNALRAVFAQRPTETRQAGYHNVQLEVLKKADYIAEVQGARVFPWRLAVISQQDSDIPNSDLVYLLADESRLEDFSWVRPGMVAWEWWNDWNVSNVNFRAGINTATYKFYIDFAAEHNIPYLLMDEGWSEVGAADLFKVVPEVDLQSIINYGKAKGVGIILWGGYLPFDRDMERVCQHYASMGVKGFKVDFMNRDDQLISEFLYRAAATCAKYKLMIDFHGIHKPTGLSRTYPNVVGYEGVYGLEQLKWNQPDMPKNDVMLPFLRQVAGPMDYTQGAMLNGSQWSFRSNSMNPMSQGTRCHQLAQYVVYEAPITMMSDAPDHYRQNPRSTQFIAAMPTVWDETVVIAGELGEYIATARRTGDTWYVGALTNWTARTLTLDLSCLGEGMFEAEMFRDGVNADRNGTDHTVTTEPIPADRKLTVHLSDGGGFAARIYRR